MRVGDAKNSTITNSYATHSDFYGGDVMMWSQEVVLEDPTWVHLHAPFEGVHSITPLLRVDVVALPPDENASKPTSRYGLRSRGGQ